MLAEGAQNDLLLMPSFFSQRTSTAVTAVTAVASIAIAVPIAVTVGTIITVIARSAGG